ncbi:hypothetical protein [Pseudomonas aeruginosa]|uniref:hypothetical protein n=1 Tax=Pseudomonas aeruginosa TaxID=287 RepID=UPI003D26BF7D
MNLKAQIEKHLTQLWDKRALAIADDPLSIDELGAPMDSIVALDALIEIGKLLPVKIPVDAVIRNGGYETKEQFVELVTKEIFKLLKKTGS